MKKRSSHLLDNLSNCLIEPVKFSGDLSGIPTHELCYAGAMLYQLSYEATQLRAGQFVGLMFSRERNDEWKKRFVMCGVRNQMKK